jgi:LuxR family maltose regulon positive regulatory protein
MKMTVGHIDVEGSSSNRPLLSTKITPPGLRDSLIPRTNLINRLKQEIDSHLILVSAPVGYGKTTLLVSLIDQISRKAIWYSLDEGDKDISRFFTYLTTAFMEIDEHLASVLHDPLLAAHTPSVETLVALFSEAVITYKKSLILLLDDYHTIIESETDHFLQFLLDNCPRNLTIVIMSRVDPPIPLARLRAQRELCEIRMNELAFAVDETDDYLRELGDLNLSIKQVRELHERTEGWPAALQLAAIAIRTLESDLSRDDQISNFINDLATAKRFMLDFLMEEVWERQSVERQQFLLHSSVLETLSAAKCDVVVYEGDDPGQSEKILLELEHDNLFILPLDSRREEYRYHHLLKEFLDHRLENFQSKSKPILHRRAAAWYQEHGPVFEAIPHLLAAGDQDLAARIIEAQYPTLISRSKIESLYSWFELLPAEILHYAPKLHLIKAWTLVSMGRIHRARDSIDRMEEELGITSDIFDSPEVKKIEAVEREAIIESTVVRAYIASEEYLSDRTIQLAQKVFPYLEIRGGAGPVTPYKELLATNHLSIGIAYKLQGKLRPASDAFLKAESLSRELREQHTFALAMGHLGSVLTIEAKLSAAKETYLRALEWLRTLSDFPTPYDDILNAGLGDLYYEWNQLDDACEYYSRSIRSAREIGHWESLISSYLGLAKVKQIQNEWEDAIALLDELATLRHRFGLTKDVPDALATRLNLWIQQGEIDMAVNLVDRKNLFDQKHPSRLAQENLDITLSRLMLAQRKYEDVITYTFPMLQDAKQAEREQRVMKFCLLRMLAKYAQGFEEDALELLDRVFKIAYPEGFLRTILDEAISDQNGMIKSLLERAIEREIFPKYASDLLMVFGDIKGTPRHPSIQSSCPPLIEPLTNREHEVLSLLANGFSNREIAASLSVASGTVNTHTYHIYSKLGVKSRTQAVAKARSIGIL